MEPGAPVYRFFHGLDERLSSVTQRNPRQIIAARKMHYISLNLQVILHAVVLTMGFAEPDKGDQGCKSPVPYQ